VLESQSSSTVLPSEHVDLTPMSASQAVGRFSGIGRIGTRPPLWRSTGIVGVIALIAAAALPLLAEILSVPG
jgi:hypothetical protein